MNKIRTNAGFALPAAIFLITILTLSLTAAFAMNASERRVLDNTSAQLDAFAVAQSGLEQFMVNRATFGFTAVPPAAYESTRVNVTGGFADVVLENVRLGVGGDDPLYVVRSTGYSTDPTLPGVPQAQRTTGQYIRWSSGNLNVRAGWLSLTGLHKNGTAGTISGVDQCGMEPDVAGISVPTPPGFSKNGNFNSDGSPPLEDLGTVQDAVDSLDLDWASISNGTAFTPHVTIPPGSWPSFADPNYWSIILVLGNLSMTPTMSGRGILIVTGNMSMSGSSSWEGIVLVGEQYASNGNNRVEGATMTGLNAMLAPNPDSAATAKGKTSLGNGQKRYLYNSCYVKRATAALGGIRAFHNAWMDNWPAY